MERVLLTPRSLTAHPHAAVEALRGQGFEVVYSTPGRMPDEAELCRLLPGTVGWLAGVEPVSEAAIGHADALRVVSRNGTGLDNLPLDLLHRKGVAVLRAEGGNATGVAELAVALIFAALRQIPFADAGIKAGGWPRRRGREICGRTVGVVGCGAVGREVVRMVAVLGASVLALDPARPALDLSADRFAWADLPTILRRSDVVSLHCPPPAGGAPLLGRDELAAMREGAILVNTARAGLVDEGALLAALEAEHLFAYATDVFSAEPPGDLTLAGHPRVIATSHIGGFTDESVDRVTQAAVANLVAALRP